MTKTIKHKKHKKHKKYKKYKTYNLKLRKKIYSGGEDDLICSKEKLFIDNLLDDRTALGLPFPINIEELTTYYRKLILIFHPDKCKHDKAAEIFIKIQERYDNLISELSSSPARTPAGAMAGWYDSEFRPQSPESETSFDLLLEPSPNILDADIIDSLTNDFINARNLLRDIQDDDAITIDSSLNLIKKSSRRFSNLSLSKINSLIENVNSLIEQINTINSVLTTLQNTFNAYEIPKLLEDNEYVKWLKVQLYGYHKTSLPNWKELVLELQQKANKLKGKLDKRKDNSLLRQTRRSVIRKVPDLLRRATRRRFS